MGLRRKSWNPSSEMKRNKIPVVLDTNVLVSAALYPASPPGQVLDYVGERGSLLISEFTGLELRQVILRPRFQRYLAPPRAREFLASVLRIAEPVTVTHSITACRDPKDDKFLELALSGHATHIITGDRDLLDLHPFRGIPILTPISFLAAAEG